MWSISHNRPFGRLSARRSTLFVLAICMALFTAITLPSTTVNAQQSQGNALQSGENLTYGGETYEKIDAPSEGSDYTFYSSACRIAEGAVYIRVGSGDGATQVICQVASSGYAWLVTFPNAERSGDTITAYGDGSITQGDYEIIVAVQQRYERYDGFPPSQAYADENPGPQNLDIPSPRPSDMSDEEWNTRWSEIYQKYAENISSQTRITIGADTASITTCDSTHTHGLGWIICPVTNWLADTMDLLYEAISDFLVVPMISTSRDNVMYYIWNLMRNIANALFIFGFLIIIYSQITNVGISNYGLKRLLPRLVIAAVLVNISYWIAALAVDASNLLGTSLNDGIYMIRESIPSSVGQEYDFSDLTWKTLAATFLSGGSAAFMAATGIAGIVASAGGSLWFLLVGLAGVIMAGLVAVLILAARQALITILVIISPLAFVAYLLPSTEKYFDKWKDLFTTLLLVFPIFSVVFGGAQLAGLAIMQNARPDNPNFFNIVVLGMIVQVAPLLITPLLIKVSGSLLGKFAGFANNPNRGLMDQTKKFAQSRSDMTKNTQLWKKDKDGNYVRHNPLAALGRWNALREADRSHKLKAYESGLEAAYAQDRRSHDTHHQSELNTMSKNIGDQQSKRHFAQEVATREAIKALDVMSRLTQEEAAYAESKNKSFYEAIQAKPGIVNSAIRNIGGSTEAAEAMKDMAKQAQDISYKQKMESDRQTNIASAVSDAYHSEMVKNEAWRKEAGASEVNAHGALRAKANAQSRIMAASTERIENYKKGFVYDNINPDDVRAKASGRNIANNEEWEAAINYVAESKNADNIIKHHQEINLTAAPPEIRQAFELAYKASSARPVYATFGKLGMAGQGIGLRPDGDGNKLIDEWQIDAAIQGKYGTSGLVRDSSKEEIMRLRKTLEAIRRGNTLQGFTADQYKAQRLALEQAFQNRDYRTQMGDKEEHLRALGKSIFDMTDADFDRWKSEA
jgi:hypothetical protein